MTFKCAACTRDSIDCDCFGGAIHQCANCKEAPSFSGWDQCLKCGIALALIEDPNYINFARKLWPNTPEFVALEQEWLRQSTALPFFRRAVA